MDIRSRLNKSLSPRGKCRLANLYYNCNRLLKNKKKIESKYGVDVLGYKKKHCFFGYYDISPYNYTNDLLYLVLDENNVADIFIRKHTESKGEKIAITKAWNWQQGCRLRWLPGSDRRIVFNDFCDDSYCSRIINVDDKEEVRISTPLYDINNDGTKGLTLNFERLGVKRPGYGYVNRKYREDYDLSLEGIDEVDLTNNLKRRLFNYFDIAQVASQVTRNYQNNYINHISYSPSCERFLFFWITIINNYHQASLMVYDFKSKMIIPLETEYKVSHYVWLDDNNILCTVYDKSRKCQYVLYNIDGSKKNVFPQLNFDGHPVIVDQERFITDSYPDKESFQHLYLCNFKHEEVVPFFDVFAVSTETVEKRTDLHPRFNKTLNKVVVDCNKKGVREMCLIDISSLL